MKTALSDDRIDPDFVAADMYLKQAREAHERGDVNKSLAARKLVAVALGLQDEPGVTR